MKKTLDEQLFEQIMKAPRIVRKTAFEARLEDTPLFGGQRYEKQESWPPTSASRDKWP